MDNLSFYELVKAHLNQPEYLHALLRVFPVEGLSLGMFALVISFFQKSRAAQITALILICLCAAAAYPVARLGENAYDTIEAKSSAEAYPWLDAHAQRAEKALFVFYTLAGVAFLALMVPLKYPKSAIPLAALTLAVSFAAMGAGMWISYAGGQIRHSEFRYGTPPEQPGGYEKMMKR
jgi:hypothetical protein